MTPRQSQAHQRLLQWAEVEGRIRTIEAIAEDERKYNPGYFAPRNTFGKARYSGYRFGANKGHKPQPHQALTVKAKR